jgi:hypothetical protein
VDLASELWRRDRALVASYYPAFIDRDPAELTYHELMKLSVLARQNEIDRAVAMSISDHVDDLREAANQFRRDLSLARVPEVLGRRAMNFVTHLDVWAAGLEMAE